MKISYNWLKNYVKTEHTPQRLSEILTDTGLEVEGLEKVEAIKGGLKGVVVGQVTSCVPHENADKLNVTTVNVGAEEELQIVCGAPNVAEGQKVIVATVGATLYPTPEEPFKIKKAKIRGVESFGMICAEDELGLGISHDGILVLPEETKVGQEAAEYFNLSDDYQIEIGLTPNRSDALGHLGVARDIVAFNKVHKEEKTGLQMPDISAYEVVENSDKVKINVEAPEACTRYEGCVISNVKIQASPDWLKNYLLAIGLTPINNVVDVTNFVMHELGTPLHAFDLSKVGEQIIVKNAQEGEKFTTLDGVERTLSEHDLMITNGKKNLAIAGVMGGLKSGVIEDTTSIFLEAAYFNPVSVRKTAKRHGLNTDASFRFERGVDICMVPFAMKRAATLIAQLGEGNISHEPIPYYPKRVEPNEVMFSYSRCNQLIGKEIDVEKIGEILNALDIQILHNNGDQVKLKIPTYRVDVTREADVIEEVLRIYGFNNIELPKKWNISLSDQNLRSEEKRLNTIADLLVSQGYFEMMNNSLTSSKYIEEHGGETFSVDNAVKMLNPLSLDLDVMRQSLIFQGLTTVAHNKNRQNADLGLFEFGKVYQNFNNEFSENKRLSIFLTGKKEPEQWNANQEEVSFFTLKGIVSTILDRLGLGSIVSMKALKKSILEDGMQLYIQKNKIGEIGWTSSKLNKSLGLKQRVYIADLDWDMILSLGNRNKVQFSPLPKTFAMRRDFSLLMDKAVTFQEIEEIARKTDKKLLKEVNLFDVYEGDKLEEGKKSYAVSFYFQDAEKTLKDDQIEKIMEKIRLQLEKQLYIELRK
ncbi:phenylalanine--tRNA ligase subunit beta [Brumimicrobium aurantiacum]|uniref:Phenylalanine--tRNA ligase beta subunit n=1 Tax=Brumimicrobium aurantiacum TaxID=1737063 RepID=A0A3E1EZS5_9FLAO|nr:phenylalanine--tRNA ligase subunit beta [Brumimicrobium aurantiacum]RFC55061.1 phenylalanine--tRNA ligase subunit beta [Brumimicrobium aurantiacum]